MTDDGSAALRSVVRDMAITDEAELAATRDGVASDPPNKCPACGRFLRKREDGSYVRHVFYDSYNGGWEWSC